MLDTRTCARLHVKFPKGRQTHSYMRNNLLCLTSTQKNSQLASCSSTDGISCVQKAAFSALPAIDNCCVSKRARSTLNLIRQFVKIAINASCHLTLRCRLGWLLLDLNNDGWKKNSTTEAMSTQFESGITIDTSICRLELNPSICKDEL